jgi:TolB-like protein
MRKLLKNILILLLLIFVTGCAPSLYNAALKGDIDKVKSSIAGGADLDLAINSIHGVTDRWAVIATNVLIEYKTKGTRASGSGAARVSSSENRLKENPKAKAINLSVMDLNDTSGLSKPEILLLTDKLINSLVRTGFTVVERARRDEILEELGFQQSGVCSESSCLVEVGQMLGVHKMIGGTIGKFGDAYVIELRLIDVATSKIEDSFSKNYQGDMIYLLDGMIDAADSFSKSIR